MGWKLEKEKRDLKLEDINDKAIETYIEKLKEYNIK